MKNFEERMRELQGERTQKEFANFLGIPLNTYTNWLLYQRRPTIDAVISICTKLKVSADWLLGLTDTRAQGCGATSDVRIAELNKILSEKDAIIEGLRGEIRGLQFNVVHGGRPVRSVKTGGASAARIA